jgi:hypothetical protein
MHIIVIDMPRRDGTGPYGTLINCTDPRTGLRRPLYGYRFSGSLPQTTPMNNLPMNPATYQGYYRYPRNANPRGIYNNPNYGYSNYVPGYGRGRSRGRGWSGRGRGRR